MIQTSAVPQVTIDSWPGLALPNEEIEHLLTFLAYKTQRPVTFRRYTPNEGYSKTTISIRVAVADGNESASQVSRVRLNGKIFELSEYHVRVALDGDIASQSQVVDDDSQVLAYIDHNRIIVPIEFTAADNEAARTVLPYIIERSIDSLDFMVDGKLLIQHREMVQRYHEAFASRVQQRITDIERELRENESEAEQAYYKIVECERKKPIIREELDFLKKLAEIKEPRLFRVQAHTLVELEASGQFTSIVIAGDGKLSATTSPIIIEHDGWRFPMGRYVINLELSGDIIIEALDPHNNAEHPHPHVATDGRPCLGNIRGDIPKMLGALRIAEALQTLHAFLCEYNPDGPYEKIGHFDPTGEYQDEDENPCDDCDERCSTYCIFDCGNNDGQYDCQDCYDYRTDYCYLECHYNEDFSRFKPCDDCEDLGTEHCYLECEYNEEWQLRNPCNSCERESCETGCPFYAKNQEMKEVIENAAG